MLPERKPHMSEKTSSLELSCDMKAVQDSCGIDVTFLTLALDGV